MYFRKLTSIGSDNGLLPGRRQAINITNAGILLIRIWGENFSKIFIEIIHFHSRKCIWKCRLRNCGNFCLGLNMLNMWVNKSQGLLRTDDVIKRIDRTRKTCTYFIRYMFPAHAIAIGCCHNNWMCRYCSWQLYYNNAKHPTILKGNVTSIL